MEIAAIISDRIATIAIPKQKETLTRLWHLYNHPEHELISSSCHASDSLETKLALFQRLESEINHTRDQLHEMHDPTHVLGKEFDSLRQELGQTFSDAFQNALLKLALIRGD